MAGWARGAWPVHGGGRDRSIPLCCPVVLGPASRPACPLRAQLSLEVIAFLVCFLAPWVSALSSPWSRKLVWVCESLYVPS